MYWCWRATLVPTRKAASWAMKISAWPGFAVAPMGCLAHTRALRAGQPRIRRAGFASTRRLRRTCDKLGIAWLERETLVLDQVRFVGTTLWSDFDALADHEQTDSLTRRLQLRDKAFRAANFTCAKPAAPQHSHFWPNHARASPGLPEWLPTALSTPFGSPWPSRTSLPSLRSADPRYGLVPGTAGFATHWTPAAPRATVAARPPACAQRLHRERTNPAKGSLAMPVVANPLGYARKGTGHLSESTVPHRMIGAKASDFYEGLLAAHDENMTQVKTTTACAHWSEQHQPGLSMNILLAVDGSAYKKMLAYLATHEDLLGASHSYTVLTVQSPCPPAHALPWAKEVVDSYHAEEADKIMAPVAKFLGRHGVEAKRMYKVGPVGETIARWQTPASSTCW